MQMIGPQRERQTVECVPRLIGCKIPHKREHDSEYTFFMLYHFIPILHFSIRAKQAVQNWDEIHKCEDVHDALPVKTSTGQQCSSERSAGLAEHVTADPATMRVVMSQNRAVGSDHDDCAFRLKKSE